MEHESTKPKTKSPSPDASVAVQTVVIFRCGWCGWPCDDKGKCLELGYDEASEYLRTHKDSMEELVNGECCPAGPNQQGM